MMPDATYRFQGFVFDGPRGALLTTEGVELPLRAKSLELLLMFIKNAGRLLGRDEIMREIWRGLVVTDDSLTQCVCDIRRALGDDEARLLRPEKGGGFVLAGEVGRPARASLHSGGTAVPPPLSIGRSVVWQESKAGRALRSWAVARVMTL